MPIVGTLPYNIQNGDSVDAIPVMANFNFIAAQVNANAPSIINVVPTLFTPVLTFGGASVGMTYTTQKGAYSRIGNVVFYWIQIVLNAVGSSTGVALIGGLPLAAATVVPDFIINGAPYLTGITFTDGCSQGVLSGTTTIGLFDLRSNGNATQMNRTTNFTGGAPISVGLAGQYFV